jgi:hypothetical protein
MEAPGTYRRFIPLMRRLWGQFIGSTSSLGGFSMPLMLKVPGPVDFSPTKTFNNRTGAVIVAVACSCRFVLTYTLQVRHLGVSKQDPANSKESLSTDVLLRRSVSPLDFSDQIPGIRVSHPTFIKQADVHYCPSLSWMCRNNPVIQILGAYPKLNHQGISRLV